MNRILIEIILIFGIALAANFGYVWWKNKQQDIGYQKCSGEIAVEVATKNVTIVEDRKKVKHENQNRDRDALIRLHCKRGWVYEPEQCAAYGGSGRSGVRGHLPRQYDHPPTNSYEQRNVVEVKPTPPPRSNYNE